MKKILIVLAVLFLTACSSDNTGQEDQPPIQYTPPTEGPDRESLPQTQPTEKEEDEEELQAQPVINTPTSGPDRNVLP